MSPDDCRSTLITLTSAVHYRKCVLYTDTSRGQSLKTTNSETNERFQPQQPNRSLSEHILKKSIDIRIRRTTVTYPVMILSPVSKEPVYLLKAPNRCFLPVYCCPGPHVLKCFADIKFRISRYLQNSKKSIHVSPHFKSSQCQKELATDSVLFIFHKAS